MSNTITTKEGSRITTRTGARETSRIQPLLAAERARGRSYDVSATAEPLHAHAGAATPLGPAVERHHMNTYADDLAALVEKLDRKNAVNSELDRSGEVRDTSPYARNAWPGQY